MLLSPYSSSGIGKNTSSFQFVSLINPDAAIVIMALVDVSPLIPLLQKKYIRY